MASEHDNRRDAERRQQINQSDEILPGDKQRADDEEQGKFDALDTGNFSTEQFGDDESDPAARQRINQSDEKLPGDKQRAKDDERTDSGSNKRKATKSQPDHMLYRP